MPASYEYIRCHFGEEICKLFKQYSNSLKKLCNIKQSVNFLIKCRTYGLIPKFISNSTTNPKKLIVNNLALMKSADNIIRNFQIKFLNLIIKAKYTELKNHTQTLNKIKQNICSVAPDYIVDEFFNTQKTAYELLTIKTREKHNKKWEQLKNEMIKHLQLKTDDGWFVNRTTIKFPIEVQLMLSMGKKFALPYNNDFPLFQIIADGEDYLQSITDDKEKEINRAKFCGLISDFLGRSRNNQKEKFLLKLYDDVMKFLAKHKKDIIITNADKGGTTVVMWKKEYIEKINDLLSDRLTYRPLRLDPTNKLQTKNNELISFLFENNIISEAEKYRMKTYTGLPPRLYCLPKIHKENCPLRPIVCSINSPVYELSKFLASILNNLTKDSKYNVRNSKEFKQKIENIKIDSNEIMVSFDVVSLFTNIPINLTLKIIEKNWEKLSQVTKIQKRKFIDLLRFCITDANYFTFNKKVYRQTHGVPMGSPLSPILADIVMEDLLDTALKELKQKPKLLCKYVDDLFAITKKVHVQETLDILNNFHEKLKFTLEEERHGILPYLDIKVIREGVNLITNWYQKPTASGRILHFNSFHPQHQKINTARNLITRIFELSHKKFKKENIQIIRSILNNNGFPANIVKKLLHQHSYNEKNRNENDNSTYIYKSMIYVPGFSERFKNITKSQKNKVKIAFKTGKSIKNCFSQLKDPLPKDLESNIIYKIPCKGNKNENCLGSYVGTTSQFLKNRISNHKSDIKNKNSHKTALATHCENLKHVPDFEKTKILHREKRFNKRMLLESLYIYKTQDTLNKKTDIDNINSIYCALLDGAKI